MKVQRLENHLTKKDEGNDFSTSAQLSYELTDDDIVWPIKRMDTDSVIMEPKQRMCCDCKVKPVKPQRNAKRPYSRCDECNRRYKREEMQKLRAKQKELVQDRPDIGMKRCTKCNKLKWYSAYSTHANSDSNELNKICDACLTKLYASQHKFEKDFTPEWWRARAYNVNTVYRNKLARKQGIPASSLSLNDLPWVCKPNDLVDLYLLQKGLCCYCGIKLTKQNLGVDHKKVLSRGGEHIKENLALCCKDCNQLKLDKHYDEFVLFLQDYAKRIIDRNNG